MQFTLRQKLVAVFGFLLLIVTFIGVQSIDRFNRLGKSIDVILRENYKSVIACQQMKESLERIDSGTLFLLLGYKTQGNELVKKNIRQFTHYLDIELHNLTLPGEAEHAQKLEYLFQEYKKTIDFVSSNRNLSMQEYYLKTGLPLFYEMKNTADSILQLNQQNMNDANNRARKQASQARRYMYILIMSAFFLSVIVLVSSNRWILKPIHRLIDYAQEIRNGNLNLVAIVETRDEIGKLSQSFNAMVESLRLFRRSDQSKMLRIRRATREVFKNLPEAIAIINTEGLIEVSTDSARSFFSLNPDSPIQKVVPQWLSLFFHDALAHIKNNGNEYKSEVVQYFINNNERYFQPRAFPIFDEEKEWNGIIILLEDVTLLRQSEEIKKNLLSTISHQLKTPLTSIRMAVHLMLEEKIGTINEKQADLLITAREESERLYGIIHDLLDISRIESGNVQMKLEPLSPYELIDESISSFQWEARDKGITLESKLPQGLSEIAADKSRLSIAVGNLISNALKYTPQGGSISIYATQYNHNIKFYIVDTGKGIPEEFHSMIFEKFFRLPGQSNLQGEGLGLSIVREIIRAHNGNISFSSVEGKGSSFEFILKRYDAAA